MNCRDVLSWENPAEWGGVKGRGRKEGGGRGREERGKGGRKDRNKMVSTFSAKGETKTQDCSRTMFDSVDTIVQKGPLIRPQRYSNGFVWRSR